MARSGLKMVFSGAEAASDATLAAMNKGGKASSTLTLELARRMREHGVIPEFSFVLGSPPNPLQDVDGTFAFIRRLKKINPRTEIVLYTYTPVPMEGQLFDGARRLGFSFPQTLEQWATPVWEQFSMQRGDGIPWVNPEVRRRVRNFERVVNAFYPTATDPHLTRIHRAALGERVEVRVAVVRRAMLRTARAASPHSLSASGDDGVPDVLSGCSGHP